jgi:hypothetical protein
VSSPIATLSPSLILALWFSWILRSRLRCQVFCLSVVEVLIVGGGTSVRISFGFTKHHQVACIVRSLCKMSWASSAFQKLTRSRRSRDRGSSSCHSKAHAVHVTGGAHAQCRPIVKRKEKKSYPRHNLRKCRQSTPPSST